MNCVDLLELLKLNNGTLTGVMCYGYIREELERPSNIFQNVTCEDGGSFRRMTLFAVKMPKYAEQLRTLGIDTDIVYVRGDILVYVPQGMVYPDWYKVCGSLRFGTKSVSNYVTLLEYSKVVNDWYILRSHLSNFSAEDSFPKEMMLAVLGDAPMPAELENIPAMQAVQTDNDFLYGGSSKLPVTGSGATIEDLKCTVPESRSDALDYSEVAEEYRRYLVTAQAQFDNFVSDVKIKYKTGDSTLEVQSLVNSLKAHLKRKNGSNSVTGQSILKKYLGRFGKSSKKAKDEIINNLDDAVRYMLTSKVPEFSKPAMSLCRSAFSDAEVFYGGILSDTIGVDFDRAVFRLGKEGISFVKIVNDNPYLLFLLGLCKYDDAELLGLLFGKHMDATLDSIRDICLVHNHVISSNSNSTVYEASDFNDLCIEDRFIPMYMAENIKLFFTGKSVRGYDTSGRDWSHGYGKATKRLSVGRIEKALKSYTDFGIGVKLDNYYTSVDFLNKELFIYDTIMDGIEKDLPYEKSEIDKYINEYEKEVGFELEEEQRDAVHLCVKKCACVAGSAGSGKTTTVGCIVYVLDKIDPSMGVRFAAPTGKSARVLQSVVHDTVKTFHSLCRIGIDSDDVFEEDEEMVSDDDTYYIFDEMSMVNLNVMYKVIKALSDSRFMFIGDIAQLESIGKGSVFANLLRFLPCVYLKVSKRSAERSGITYNSDIINNFSNTDNYRPLRNTSDFVILEANDENIQNVVRDVCDFYINGGENKYNLPMLNVSKDDIQVITPVVKVKYTWGSKYLNRVLQPLFNKVKTAEDAILINGERFIKGDRVIHTTENTYSMQWYSSYKNGCFTKTWGYSVVNGQVGTLVGYYPASACIFEDEEGVKPKGFAYPDNMRDDSTFDAYNGYFIVVRYIDDTTDSEYYALYRAMLKDDKELVKYDTGLLDLFYAGSTHKMQGSQSKVAICCFGTMHYGSFLSRNMLYTTVTRGSDLDIIIGSSSQIEKSRSFVKAKNVLTVGELITRDAK